MHLSCALKDISQWCEKQHVIEKQRKKRECAPFRKRHQEFKLPSRPPQKYISNGRLSETVAYAKCHLSLLPYLIHDRISLESMHMCSSSYTCAHICSSVPLGLQ